ncbi:hypothetical protein EDC01DRAFT_624493, partial [Geopyxis carbonaria]
MASGYKHCDYCFRRFANQKGLSCHLRSKHLSRLQTSLTHKRNSPRTITYIEPDHEPDNKPILDATSPIVPVTRIYLGAALPIDDSVLTPLDERPEWNPLAPFETVEQWHLARASVERNLTKTSIDSLIQVHLINEQAQTPSVDFLRGVIRRMPERDTMPVEWQQSTIELNGESRTYWYRCPMAAVRYIIGHEPFAKHMRYAPEISRDSQGCRAYSEMWTGKWWNRAQRHVPEGAMIVPIILSSDKTELSAGSGDQTAYPLYLTIGNLAKAQRRAVSTNSIVLIGLLPNPAGHYAGDHWTKRQYHAAMTIILRSLQEPSHNGTNIVCADGRTRLGYPRIASFVSDFPEQTLFTLTVYMWCPRCELDPEKFPGLDQTAIPRTTERYAGLSIDQCHRRGKWKFEPDFSLAAGHKGFEPYKCIHPDRLHQLLTGTFKRHAWNWAIRFLSDKLGKEEALRQIDERFHAIPHFTGLRALGKGRITKVKQFTGAEYKDMLRVWIPALAPLFTGYPQHITFMRHLMDFILISGYHQHTEDNLGYLKEALDGMAAGMHLWAPYRNSTNTGDDSNVKVPTMHAMSHYIECIQDMGSCDNTDTEAFEGAHHWMCKLAYRASNKVNYVVQMLAWEQR